MSILFGRHLCWPQCLHHCERLHRSRPCCGGQLWELKHGNVLGLLGKQENLRTSRSNPVGFSLLSYLCLSLPLGVPTCSWASGRICHTVDGLQGGLTAMGLDSFPPWKDCPQCHTMWQCNLHLQFLDGSINIYKWESMNIYIYMGIYKWEYL